MLLSGDAINIAAAVCTAQDFYKPRHGNLFRAMTQLSDRGIDAAYAAPVDLAALIDSEATRWRKLIEDRDLKLN